MKTKIFLYSLFQLIISVKATYAQIDNQSQMVNDNVFYYNPNLLNTDKKARFFEISEYPIQNGLVNTSSYLKSHPELNRQPEMLRFQLPPKPNGVNDVKFYFGYFEIENKSSILSSYMSFCKHDYESYSKVFIDRNLDQNFNNDGSPLLITEYSNSMDVVYEYLGFNIQYNMTFSFQNSKDPFYIADTLFMRKNDNPLKNRYKSYKLWKTLVSDDNHFFMALNPGFGGGGKQSYKYVNSSNSNYIEQSFSFNRVGLGLTMGYEYKNIIVGASFGIEFWKTSDFKRILKEGDSYDQFGGVYENQEALPQGYYYTGIKLGYNINASHKIIIQPSMEYGLFKYKGAYADDFNSTQSNRNYLSASLKTMLPINSFMLVSAGFSYNKYFFTLKENISTVVIMQEQELQLEENKMNSVTFQFGLVFRL